MTPAEMLAKIEHLQGQVDALISDNLRLTFIVHDQARLLRSAEPARINYTPPKGGKH